MKKLMIAAFAVAFAAAAQAAQVTWTAKTIPQSGTSESYYAVLVDVGSSELTTAADVAAALQAGKFDGTIMWQGAATWVSKSSTIAVAASKQTLPAGYEANQEVDYMTLVFDAATIADAENYYSTTKSESALTAKISEAGALTLAQGDVSGGTWQAVPEPTTGLLMLLGMGALTLRRRRA